MVKPFNKTSVCILVIFGIFLNQSDVILGVNISIADLFFILILFLLLLQNRIKFHKQAILFFLLLTALLFYTSLYHVPKQLLYYPSPSSVMTNYIKLLTVFMYFVVGCSLSMGENEIIIRWYSHAAAVIGASGFLLAFFNAELFSHTFFYGGLRLKGLMNDPNYFSIIQNTAIAYFSRKRSMKKIFSAGIIVILVLSIMASGSKTGLIILISYTIIRIFESLITVKFTLKAVIVHILLLIPVIMSVLFIADILPDVLEIMSDKLPALRRIQLLFTDFDKAVSDMGSNRDLTWEAALGLIKRSPVLGIGIGTYSGLAKKLYNTSLVAHNTYLQLFSEWGILLALTLFIYLFLVITKVSFNKENYQDLTVVLKDMLMIFMIGSLAVSLNNARMFWLFLGMLVTDVHNQKVLV